MTSATNLGQLIRVPLEKVEVPESLKPDPLKVLALKDQLLSSSDRRNWLPVLVTENIPRHYTAIAHIEAIKALDLLDELWIWVAIVDERSIHQVQIGTGLEPARINLCSANEKAIADALKVLRDSFTSSFRTLDIDLAARAIAQAPGRRFWKDFQLLPKLRCGLAAKNLPFLDRVFFLCPEEVPLLEPINLNAASPAEVLEFLQDLSARPEGCKLLSLDVERVASVIAEHPDRPWWRDSKALTKLGIDLTAAAIKPWEALLVFQPLSPPSPNQVKYLLEGMSATALKAEAKARKIPVPSPATKATLVELLINTP